MHTNAKSFPVIPDSLQPQKNRSQKNRHPCDKCKYKATMRCSLKRHNEPVHGTVRYSCDECDYKATQDVSLNG